MLTDGERNYYTKRLKLLWDEVNTFKEKLVEEPNDKYIINQIKKRYIKINNLNYKLNKK